MVEKVATANPFAMGTRSGARRAKVFVWGSPGAGKTCFALSWPSVAVIDFERGTEPWETEYQFDPLRPRNLAEAYDSVRWLQSNPHPYKTIVVDPFTIFCEMVQKRRSDQKLSSQSHNEFEMADFEFRDWGSVGNEIKQFLQALVSLDVNIVLTARDKAKYTKTAKGLEETGRTWDAHKSVEGFADTIIHLKRIANPDGTSKFAVGVKKDRGSKIGVAQFEASTPREIYGRFERGFGIESLSAQSEPGIPVEPPRVETPVAVELATPEQVAEFRQLVVDLKVPPEKLENSLRMYGVKEPEFFSRTVASEVLGKMRAKLAAVNGGVANGIAN